ncbi:hypothetical protein PQE68_gp073 [Bacillus phage vB_BanS_Sophrita]|uniref:Uncharacterized protein n=2 Tax=Sophritavirus TaxID=3044834 RepID=A0A3T0IHZ9_9CAUD|nr:hypothetical protein PQE68_gp073 [Bacillus phage vB_BanS_Sophrita]YP_010680115.1 hypothetical protein PQE69_gp117 [Bacillus phage pW2]AZU99001.1 hypothetical protein pW2_215 [Bacillus phage pW2]UGO50664.1 hypothetical protein SOPHRITA_73 [Bacillus phage vB_BanS_Sophrita]
MMQLQDLTKYVLNENGQVFTLNEDYNGLWYLSRTDAEGRKKTLSVSTEEMIEALTKYYTPELTQEEKAQRYDELFGWYLWLKRRTNDGIAPKSQVETFLKGFGKIFKGGDETDKENV